LDNCNEFNLSLGISDYVLQKKGKIDVDSEIFFVGLKYIHILTVDELDTAN
jgi:hypothetical protein